MARKRKKRAKSAEFWAKYRDQFAETDRLIQERLAYYRAKRQEDQVARGESAT